MVWEEIWKVIIPPLQHAAIYDKRCQRPPSNGIRHLSPRLQKSILPFLFGLGFDLFIVCFDKEYLSWCLKNGILGIFIRQNILRFGSRSRSRTEFGFHRTFTIWFKLGWITTDFHGLSPEWKAGFIFIIVIYYGMLWLSRLNRPVGSIPMCFRHF